MKYIDAERFLRENRTDGVADQLYAMASASDPLSSSAARRERDSARAGVIWKSIIMENLLPHLITYVRATAASSVYVSDMSLNNLIVSCGQLQAAFDGARHRDCSGLPALSTLHHAYVPASTTNADACTRANRRTRKRAASVILPSTPAMLLQMKHLCMPFGRLSFSAARQAPRAVS